MRPTSPHVPAARSLRTTAALVAAVILAACSGTDGGSVVAPPMSPDQAPSAYTYPSAIYRSHVEFGTPYDASTAGDLLLSRRTHYLSHNCARGGPNWVSWNLNKTHFGDAPRSTSFTSDASLPSGCYRVVNSDYTNSGYSRGHMVRSEERTWSVEDNKATFVMTNILPQYQDLNGGPWYKLEQYLQDLAQAQNKELYVISGGYGSRGTLLGAGKVTIPTRNWKIAVIMPYGQGLANATSTSSIQVLAVDMPNVTGIAANSWQSYITTVDAIESATGYNFLNKLNDTVEGHWEARRY